MIQEFIDLFMAKKADIARALADEPPVSYIDIIKVVATALNNGEDHGAKQEYS